MASFMSARGRALREFVEGAAWFCIGFFTPAKRSAATTNDTASAINAALRPKTLANTPPSAAPTANMIPHVLPNRALAFRRSSSLPARLGIAAPVAGLTNEASPAMMLCDKNKTQIPMMECDNIRRPANAWKIDTVTRIRLRSNRSANEPAIGDMNKPGIVIDTKTRDTRNRESVVSSTRPAIATNVNQSPRNDTTCAPKTSRISRLR